MKTSKSVSRRVRVSGSGKLMYRRRRPGSKAKMRAKSRYRSRKYSQLSKTQRRNVKRTMPGV